MRLTFSELPGIEILDQLNDNQINRDQFKSHTAEYKKRIFKEMAELYNPGSSTQNDVNEIIDSLITRVAELSAACLILQGIVKNFYENQNE